MFFKSFSDLWCRLSTVVCQRQFIVHSRALLVKMGRCQCLSKSMRRHKGIDLQHQYFELFHWSEAWAVRCTTVPCRTILIDVINEHVIPSCPADNEIDVADSSWKKLFDLLHLYMFVLALPALNTNTPKVTPINLPLFGCVAAEQINASITNARDESAVRNVLALSVNGTHASTIIQVREALLTITAECSRK